MKIINDKIEFRDSAEYQDDKKFLKVINRIIDNKDKQIKACNKALHLNIKNSFITCDFEHLNVIKHKMKNIIELTSILLEKVIAKYQIEQLSIDEIKDELLSLSDNQEYKKDIEKIFN
jgi:hypothetical protein|nr:MAG TPA: hypothetical protein [Caudoviricetes sp.]